MVLSRSARVIQQKARPNNFVILAGRDAPVLLQHGILQQKCFQRNRRLCETGCIILRDLIASLVDVSHHATTLGLSKQPTTSFILRRECVERREYRSREQVVSKSSSRRIIRCHEDFPAYHLAH